MGVIMGLNWGRWDAGWYFDKITLTLTPRGVFIGAGAACDGARGDEGDAGSRPCLELVRRERAGKLASWQARLRADRDFDWWSSQSARTGLQLGGRGGRGRQILLGLAQEIGNTQPELLDRILIFLILCDVQPTTQEELGTQVSWWRWRPRPPTILLWMRTKDWRGALHCIVILGP